MTKKNKELPPELEVLRPSVLDLFDRYEADIQEKLNDLGTNTPFQKEEKNPNE